MKIFTAIDRYVFKLVLMPMIGVFALAAMLLTLEKMLRLMEFVSTEGGPITIVFRMLLNVMPEYAGMAIPLGLLLGILFAFRKLATTSELDVLRAVGWSYTRLLRVPYIITLLLMAVNFAIVGYWQPLARYDYEQLDFELRSGALGAAIKVGEFTQIEDRVALRIEESQEDGRVLKGIFARIANDKGQVLSISAREGRFLANREDRNTIIFRLSDGTIVQDEPGQTPRVLSFTQHDLPIELPRIEEFRRRGGEAREYLLPELFELGWRENNVAASTRVEGQAIFNYRMVEVLMMLMLPLLAVALAIPPKRSTSALGVFVAIVMVVAYHKVNQYAQEVAAIGRIDPVLALWGPFVLLALLIAWMYYRVSFVPGGQAIGALEAMFAKLMKRIRAFFRSHSRMRDMPDPEEDEAFGAA